jgi:hypothetical protein
MEKSTNGSNLGVTESGPLTFKIPARQYFNENNTRAPKPDLAETVIFSHSILENGNSHSLPTEESMGKDSKSQLRERRDGDSCV